MPMGLYILHLHLHGLFRGHDLELGRDADTGGQTNYVLELAKALGQHSEVDRLEVITRCIEDRRVSPEYAVHRESLTSKASVLRLPFGPRRYLRKELLWPNLDQLVDALVLHITRQQRRPDWIHAHYADAGWVGAQIQQRLGIPLVFTGHSLGREKQRRLLEIGQNPEQVNHRYAMERRIGAEEEALAAASMVVTSTRQEIRVQYERYSHFHPEMAEVIPPGVDTTSFYPQASHPGEDSEIADLFRPFLREPDRPCLLAVCRPDRRKNIPALIDAFGSSPLLREKANLLLVLGNREGFHPLERSQREEWHHVLEAIDRQDLYGQVAYPKHHSRSQVPAIYRWAAARRGVFVNPALTEPFGLTLIEAAACGLPVVATNDGGPIDILGRCRNGLLVDVSSSEALRTTLEKALAADAPWDQWRQQGLEAVQQAYSWEAHASRYLKVARPLCAAAQLESTANLKANSLRGRVSAPTRLRQARPAGQSHAHAPHGPRFWLTKQQ